ncbi:MAG: rhomboid family intramembrane serine protease [Propionicimonas sp.]
MAQPPYGSPQYQVAPQCFRHPGRQTYIACQRCGRPICPECMISAAVGFQCPECVAEGVRTTRQNQGPYGGLRSANPMLTSISLIGINVGVWMMLFLTGGSNSPWFRRLALTPVGACLVTDQPGSYYPNLGHAACSRAVGGTWAPGVADGAYWQLITSAFTHLEVWHIGFNMLALWFLGPQLEQAIGRARFLALYLLSALAGSVVVLWLASPTTSTLGASGAVFGLMGALLVIALKVRANVQTLLAWLAMNIVFTFTGSGISWQGHLGGLLGGMAVAAIIVGAPRENRARVQLIGLVGFGVALLVLAALRVLMLA